MPRNLILLFATSLILLSCTSQKPTEYDLIITNVNIVDVAGNNTSEPMHVGINGDTIALVIPAEAPWSHAAKNILEGKGKYLMPGLWDMHVHFRGGDTLIAENKEFLGHFLDYGVTTVRDAGGDLSQALLQWKADIAAGELSGPDIFTSGPKLDGARPAWPGSLRVTSRESLKTAIDSIERMGADYVKIYDGTLTEDLYYEIIAAAEKRGFMITGHMPMDADLFKAKKAGLDGIEHLYYLLAISAANGDSIRALNRGYQSLPLLLDNFDHEVAASSFVPLAQSSFYITPTLHITKVLDELKYADHSQDSLLQQMGDGIVKSYQRRERSAKGRSNSAQSYTEKRSKIFMSMVLPLHESGALLLAGSDCGAFNSYVYPGASLHEELILMTEAGLTPAEALATSVINGPRFFNLESKYGKIAEGKTAHLLLLDKDPLKDIRSITRIHCVFKDGEIIMPGKVSP